MPHDMNGDELKVGATVFVPCKVKAIHLTEEYCNLDLETNISMYPSNNKTSLTLNSRQVTKKGGEIGILRGARVFLDWLNSKSQNEAWLFPSEDFKAKLRQTIEDADRVL
jgi:hypothetical protein